MSAAKTHIQLKLVALEISVPLIDRASSVRFRQPAFSEDRIPKCDLNSFVTVVLTLQEGTARVTGRICDS